MINAWYSTLALGARGGAITGDYCEHDADAYVAGYELGALGQHLSQSTTVIWARLRAANVRRVYSVATARGYLVSAVILHIASDPGWATVTLVPAQRADVTHS